MRCTDRSRCRFELRGISAMQIVSTMLDAGHHRSAGHHRDIDWLWERKTNKQIRKRKQPPQIHLHVWAVLRRASGSFKKTIVGIWKMFSVACPCLSRSVSAPAPPQDRVWTSCSPEAHGQYESLSRTGPRAPFPAIHPRLLVPDLVRQPRWWRKELVGNAADDLERWVAVSLPSLLQPAWRKQSSIAPPLHSMSGRRLIFSISFRDSCRRILQELQQLLPKRTLLNHFGVGKTPSHWVYDCGHNHTCSVQRIEASAPPPSQGFGLSLRVVQEKGAAWCLARLTHNKDRGRKQQSLPCLLASYASRHTNPIKMSTSTFPEIRWLKPLFFCDFSGNLLRVRGILLEISGDTSPEIPVCFRLNLWGKILKN